MIEAIIILSIVLVLVSSLVLLPSWLTHIEMTKDNTKVFGWASYRDFKREFVKYNWTSLRIYSDSYEDFVSDSYFHADIFKINGIGMLMRTPFAHILAHMFVKKYMNGAKMKYDWSKNEYKM